MDITSYLLGKSSASGDINLEEKEVTISENKTTLIEPSEGYNGLSSVSVTTNVPTGSDLSNYFNINPSSISPRAGYLQKNYIKGFSDFVIPDSESNLVGLFEGWEYETAPTVVCNNNVTRMTAMVGTNTYGKNPTKLKSIDLSKMNVSNVEYMAQLFSNCTALTSFDLTGWNVGNVTTMAEMFGGCTSIINIDLSNLLPLSLTTTEYMFYNCTNATFIDIRQFDLVSLSNYSNMFGTSSSNGPADNCLIVVKDEIQKAWVNTNFSRLTNVQTVAEYEAL